MSELEFSEPTTNLLRAETQVAFKDWPYRVGAIELWSTRHCEFNFQTSDFHCILSANQLREIADKHLRISCN